MIVFSHANSYSAATYSQLLAGWRSAGHEVAAVEHFGHDAQFPVDRGWRGMTRQLTALMDSLPEPRVWLVGHSMGGYLSLLAAGQRPERVRGIVLLDSPIVYGSDSKTIVIPYSAVDEVFVEINDPRNGSYSNNLAPTFSWTSAEPNVTVRVYEAGLNHHSPQDALTGGNPYLEENVVGTNTLTYPTNAQRQLQENKAYVLQIEANVSSSRGPMKSVSQPVVFRITNDNLGNILDYFLNSVSGNVSATYSTLRAEPTKWIPWSPYGNITLNGTILSESDLQVLLKELSTQQDVKLELSVENQ